MIARLQAVPALLPLYLPYFISSAATAMLIPVLPLYAADFNVLYGLIGLVIAAEAIGTLLGDVPAGLLLRRFSTRQVIALGLSGLALLTAALSVAATIEIVILCRLGAGFFRALYSVAHHHYLTTEISPDWRGRAIAIYGGVYRLGGFVGPALGGVLALAIGLRPVFVLFALLVGLSLLLVLACMGDTRHSAGYATPRPERRSLWSLLLAYRYILVVGGAGQIFAQMIRGGRSTLLPLYGADVLGLDVGTIGAIVSAGAALDVLMVYFAGLTMDRLGRKYAIVPCFAIQAAGMLLLPLAHTAGGLLLVALILGFGNGLGSGTMMTLGSDVAPPAERGEFLGVWRLIGDIGFSGGPIIVGAVADALVLPAAALAMSGAGLASVLIFGLFVPETLRPRKKHEA
ncbi:MAG: MFS transporter [Anaerolineae bacterium]|jgi:MFS family permease|nr:MFS transporter [Anaerolineae bacterium]